MEKVLKRGKRRSFKPVTSPAGASVKPLPVESEQHLGVGSSAHEDADELGDKTIALDGFAPANTVQSEPHEEAVPVTAIGASAGGLEPIEQFFDAMAIDSGCAFVIIQHLSPDFRSLMDELLARHSTMPIFRITDGMQLQPNSIYLNPPRSVMTISTNTLLVKAIEDKDTVYLPIDIFFQSLAKDRGDSAIALVLSGTGSDGTLGSRSIKHAGGKVLVQDPQTTRFDGMPRSVLSEGYSTLVASPHVLAQSVQRLINNESLSGLDTSERKPIDDPLSDVLSMLEHSHGTDFLQYKGSEVQWYGNVR